MDHVDRAGERGRAEVDRRRTAQHLDALDVVQTDGLELRDECPTGRDAVDEQQQVIDLAHTEQTGHGAGRAGIAPERDADAAEQRQRCSQIGRTPCADFVAGDNADRTGHFLNLVAEARRGDLHGIEPG